MIIYKHLTVNQLFYNICPTSTFILPLLQVQAWSCICSMCNIIYLLLIFFWCALFRYLYFYCFSCVCNSLHCLHPSSIRCWGSNPQPLDYEPSALTTRPVFFNLGSPEPRGSAKIFLGSSKYLNILLLLYVKDLKKCRYCNATVSKLNQFLI